MTRAGRNKLSVGLGWRIRCFLMMLLLHERGTRWWLGRRPCGEAKVLVRARLASAGAVVSCFKALELSYGFFLQVSTYHLTRLQHQITLKKMEKLVATQQPRPQPRFDTAIGVSVDGSPSSWYLSLHLMTIHLPAPRPLSGKHNQESTHPLISPQQEQAPPKPLPYQRITLVVCPTNRNPHKATRSTRSSTAPAAAGHENEAHQVQCVHKS